MYGKNLLLLLLLLLPTSFLSAQLTRKLMADSPWGICAHPHRTDEFNNLDKEIALMQAAGIRWVREDFHFARIYDKSGKYNFDLYDELIDHFQKADIQILPILQGYGWEVKNAGYPELVPLHKHIYEWRAYVKAVVSRYHDRISCWEIWNEEDGGFWRPDNPCAEQYVEILRSAYEEIHKIDTNATVIVGGLCGLNAEYLSDMYKNGAKDYFDAIAIHPYGRGVDYPDVRDKLERFRKVMKENGDAEKPLWITEGGASTYRNEIEAQNPEFLQQLLTFGLEHIGHKGTNGYNTAVLDTSHYDLTVKPEFINGISSLLPEHKPDIVSVTELDSDKYPVLIWHGGESVPEEILPVLTNYVAKGGLLVTVDSIPFYYITRINTDNVRKSESASGKTHPLFHIDYRAWWTDKTIPHQTKMSRINPRLRNCFQPVTRGYANRYLGTNNLESGDVYIPILQAVDKNGNVVADMVSFYKTKNSRGGIIVSIPSLLQGYTESEQANLYQRVYLSYLAQGFQRIFLYDMHDDGTISSEKEHNFGIVDFEWNPKPAYYAYQSLTSALGKNPIFIKKLNADNSDIQALLFKNNETNRYILALWSTDKLHHLEVVQSKNKVKKVIVGQEVGFIKVGSKNVRLNND